MLNSIFQWIYCLNITVLILMIAVLTVVFALVYTKYLYSRWWHLLIGVLLIIFISVILLSTLLTRIERAETLTPILVPLASYQEVLNGGNPELLRSCFMNMLLFYPAGLLASVLLPRKWSSFLKILLVGIVFMLMSAGIEYAQYAYTLGQAEVDDIIHNTLGAVIGGAVGSLIVSYKKPDS